MVPKRLSGRRSINRKPRRLIDVLLLRTAVHLGNCELTAMRGYNQFGNPRSVGTEREETGWNR
jgi:hypothetical protein